VPPASGGGSAVGATQPPVEVPEPAECVDDAPALVLLGAEAGSEPRGEEYEEYEYVCADCRELYDE
jgi:hypothetical protein